MLISETPLPSLHSLILPRTLPVSSSIVRSSFDIASSHPRILPFSQSQYKRSPLERDQIPDTDGSSRIVECVVSDQNPKTGPNWPVPVALSKPGVHSFRLLMRQMLAEALRCVA